jgi:hypothetical protein
MRMRWVMVCTSDGGSADPEKNLTLFNVLKKARADGVPKANIQSALQKVRVYAYIFIYLLVGLTWTICFFLRISLGLCFVLGRGWEGRDGAVGDVRGACPRLCRTYHVRARAASHLSSTPSQMRVWLTCERECLTDNGNRTLHQIREILNEHTFVLVPLYCCCWRCR